MKLSLLVCALCLALVAGVSGCGGDDDATSQETQSSSATAAEDRATTAEDSATTTDDSETTTPDGGGSDSGEADADGDAKPDDGPGETPPSEVVLGDYESEGPFSAVSGQKGDKKPRFTPSGQPAPKEIVTRDLEVGSGPAAQPGDEVSVYFAGAIFQTGKVELYGWPPSAPSVFELGAGLYGKEWERTIEGMKAGGIRQVILPSSEFAQGKPVDYVIALIDLKPKSG